MEKVYSSKIDAWLGILMGGVIILCIGVFIQALLSQDASEIVGGVIALITGAGLPIWLILGTKYVLGESELKIHSGPFKWNVPYSGIRHIEPTRNPLSSPALSLDRIMIEYGKWDYVLISPKDKSAFIKELNSRLPV